MAIIRPGQQPQQTSTPKATPTPTSTPIIKRPAGTSNIIRPGQVPGRPNMSTPTSSASPISRPGLPKVPGTFKTVNFPGNNEYAGKTRGQFLSNPTDLNSIVNVDRNVPLTLKFKVKGDNKEYQVDHIVPLWLGGTNAEENLQALSVKVHGKKTWANDDLNNPKSVISRYRRGEINLIQARIEVMNWEKPKTTLEFYGETLPKTAGDFGKAALDAPVGLAKSMGNATKTIWNFMTGGIQKYVTNTGIRVGESLAYQNPLTGKPTKEAKALEEANNQVIQAKNNLVQLGRQKLQQGNPQEAERLFQLSEKMQLTTANDLLSDASKSTGMQVAGEALGATLDLLPFTKGIGFAPRVVKGIKNEINAVSGVTKTAQTLAGKGTQLAPKLVKSRYADVAGKLLMQLPDNQAAKLAADEITKLSVKGITSPGKFYSSVLPVLQKHGLANATGKTLLRQTVGDFNLLINESQPIFRLLPSQIARVGWADLGKRFLTKAGGEGALYGFGFGLSDILQHPNTTPFQKATTLVVDTGFGALTQRGLQVLGPKIVRGAMDLMDKVGKDVKPPKVYEYIRNLIKTSPEIKEQAVLETPSGIKVETNDRAVLENWIKNNDKLDYKVDTELAPGVASRFEWDYKNQRGTIYAKDSTTASNLAHELGHFFDRQISEDVSKKFSDIIPNYFENKNQIDSILTKYVVNKTGGNASSEVINKEVQRLADNFMPQIEKLAIVQGERRVGAGEQFAAAFSFVVDNPERAKQLAPDVAGFFDQQLTEAGVKRVTPATKIEAAMRVPKAGEKPTKLPTASDKVKTEAQQAEAYLRKRTNKFREAKSTDIKAIQEGQRDYVVNQINKLKPDDYAVIGKNKQVDVEAFGEVFELKDLFERGKDTPADVRRATELLSYLGKNKFEKKGFTPQPKKPEAKLNPEGKPKFRTEENTREEIFIREATKKEAKGGINKSRGFESIPDKEGYEKVYKPYAEKPGYYYSKIETSKFRTGDNAAFKGVEKDLVKESKRLFGDEGVRIAKQILTPEGKTALGKYQKGMIEIVDGQADKSGTFYHEAAHKAFDIFLTKEEQVALLLESKKKFGSKTFEQAEEDLAENFINYVNTKQGLTGKLKLLADTVVQRIKSYLGNEDKLQKFYGELLAGQKVEVSKSAAGRATVKIPVREGTTVKAFKGAPITTEAFKPGKFNTSDDVIKTLKTIAEENNNYAGERRSATLEELRDFSKQYLGDENLYKTVPAEIRQNIGRMKAAQQTMIDLATDLQASLKSVNPEKSKDQDLVAVKEKLFQLEAVSKAFAGARTEASHLFSSLKVEMKPGENDMIRGLMADLKNQGFEVETDMFKAFKMKEKALNPKLSDKPFAIWYASILSGPKTALRNVVSTAFHLTQEVGNKFLYPKFWPELPAAMKGLSEGFGIGAKEAMKVLKGKPFEGRFMASGDVPLKPPAFKGKFGQMLDLVGRSLNAQDKLFLEAARQMETRALEFQVKRGKLKLTPTEISEKASNYAQFVTYRNKPEGVIGAVAHGMHAMIRKAPALKIVVPFVDTVANVANRQLDYIPVINSLRVYKAFTEKGSREGQQALARALIGTAATAYIMKNMWGQISGKGPTSYNEQLTLQETGWRPNSVKINNTWYPYTYWGSMAGVLALAGNIHDAIVYNNADDKSLTELVGAGIGGWSQSLMDATFLSGVSNLMDAANGKITWGKYLTDTGVGLVPIPAIYTQTKDMFFQTKSYSPQTFEEKLLYKLGFVESLQPTLDVFGEQVSKDKVYGLTPSDEIGGPIGDYFRTHPDVRVTKPARTTTVYTTTGYKRKLLPAEYTQFVQRTGQELKAQMLKWLESGYFDNHDAQKAIDKFIRESREKAKDDMFGDQERNLRKYKQLKD